MALNTIFVFTMLEDRCFSSCSDPDFKHLKEGALWGAYWNDVTEEIEYRDIDGVNNIIPDDKWIPTGAVNSILGFNVSSIFQSGQVLPKNGYTNPNVPSVYISNYQFCDGIDLIQFTVSAFSGFPYVSMFRSEGVAECTGGVACDISIDDVEVTNATSSSIADGEIEVTASSTRTIEYIINQSGSAQSSNVFSNLLPGEYTITAIDSIGCEASITVNVENQAADTYGVLYRIGYKDLNGNSGRFDIEEYEYGGSINEVTSGGVPVNYVLNEADQFDIFKTLNPSYVEVSLPELTKFGYLDLFTQDNRRYRGIWYKDTGSGFEELWRGFLDPTTFSGSYNWQPEISLVFIDGLARLGDNQYRDGEITYNDIKLSRVLGLALTETDLELPIHVGINVYENSHDTTANDCPLEQTFIDQESFYDEDGEALTYREVVDKILRPFGVVLRQWNGAWWVIRVEELQNDFDYRIYNTTGDTVTGNDKYEDGRIYLRRACVTDARAVWGGDQSIEILKPAKEFKIDFKFDKRTSILENYSAERGNPPPFWTFNNVAGVSGNNVTTLQAANGNASFMFSYSTGFNGNTDFSDAYMQCAQQNIEYTSLDKLKISFKYGVDRIDEIVPYIIIRFRIKIGFNFLQQDGTWSTTDNIYRIYQQPDNGFNEVDLEFDFPDITLGTVVDTLDFRIYAYNLRSADFGYFTGAASISDGEVDFRASDTDDAKEGKIVSVLSKTLGTKTGVNYLLFYRLADDDAAESEPDVIRPDDYGTSGKVWKLEKFFFLSRTNVAGAIGNSKFYIDDVIIDTLPNGEEARENLTITAPNNNQFIDNYEYEITAGDRSDVFISSANYIYNNLFRLSNGGNTTRWNRDGVSESLTIQKLLMKQFVRQYSTPTFKLSGTITTNNEGTHTDVTPLSHLVETQDEGKIYYINGLTINDKSLEYEVNLIHSKAKTTFPSAANTCDGNIDAGGDDDDGGNGGQFNGDFNADFGGDFDTILN